jgi:AraC-like DNA-binding protein
VWTMGSRRLDQVKNWPAVAAECKYQLQIIAAKFSVSDRTLRRYIQRRFGTKAKHWIDGLRAQVAAQKLREGESVKKVASETELTEPGFSRFFKRVKGVPPKKFPTDGRNG